MSEETEGKDTGAEAAAGGVDPAAVALALNAANGDPSMAEDECAFLRPPASRLFQAEPERRRCGQHL